MSTLTSDLNVNLVFFYVLNVVKSYQLLIVINVKNRPNRPKSPKNFRAAFGGACNLLEKVSTPHLALSDNVPQANKLQFKRPKRVKRLLNESPYTLKCLGLYIGRISNI